MKSERRRYRATMLGQILFLSRGFSLYKMIRAMSSRFEGHGFAHKATQIGRKTQHFLCRG